MGELTVLLQRANEGDAQARQALYGLAYDELHRLARMRLRGDKHTLLDTTALVHESFMRFVDVGRLALADRAHFFAYAASVMRSVIIDYVRQRQAERRGGGAEHVPLDTGQADRLAAGESQVLDVHEALEGLAEQDPVLVRVVEMRYFAGMSDDEIAAALAVSRRTVQRHWQRARLLLAAALG